MGRWSRSGWNKDMVYHGVKGTGLAEMETSHETRTYQQIYLGHPIRRLWTAGRA